MLVREDYLKIIEEIRNLEKGALDEYINKKLVPLQNENAYFLETLYKDIFYVISDVNKSGEGDLVIENGDFVIENGDFKVSGYQTRLHDMGIWLHMQMVQKNLTSDFEKIKTGKYGTDFVFLNGVREFEENVLTIDNHTIEYRKKLDEIRISIKKERLENFDKPIFIKRLYIVLTNPDFWILKFKLFGNEIKFNEVILALSNKNRTKKLKENANLIEN